MDALTALFGDELKVKILRLFLFNPEATFLLSEIAGRTMAPANAVSREIARLVQASFIKKRQVTKEIPSVRGNKTVVKRATGLGCYLDKKFPHLEPLKNLLTVSSIAADEALTRRFSGIGRLKLLVASGVFIQSWDARVDLLIVGEDLDLRRIESIIKRIEAEIGKELAYSAFETADFEYRLGIHDRLIRDILDYPHTTLVDRLGIETR